MKLLKILAASLTLLALWPGQVSFAQHGVVFIPPVTANHCVKWNAPNIIQDSGGACGSGSSNVSVAGSTGDLQDNNGSSNLAASHLNDNGTIIKSTESVDTETNAQFWEVPNASSTGTTLHKLAKYTGAPSAAVIATTSDTVGILGIVAGGAGTTGNAQIAVSGQATCIFDGATVAGDFVIASTSSGGECSDGGATDPTGVAVLGNVLSTNVAGGAYGVALYPPTVQSVGSTGNPGGGNGGITIHGSPTGGTLTGWFSGKAIEQISVGSGLTLTGTTLSSSGGTPSYVQAASAAVLMRNFGGL